MALVYSSVANVQARVPGRTLTEASKPTLTQVGEWLEEAEAMILGALASCGISQPAAESNGGKIIKSWVCDFAEGHLREAWASTAGDENRTGSPQLERFTKILDAIYAYPARCDQTLNGGASSSSTSRARGANTDTEADDYVAPEFTRNMVF